MAVGWKSFNSDPKFYKQTIIKYQLFLEGGIGFFGFAVLDIFLIGFSVFVSKDFGFSVLVFNAVCGFFVF